MLRLGEGIGFAADGLRAPPRTWFPLVGSSVTSSSSSSDVTSLSSLDAHCPLVIVSSRLKSFDPRAPAPSLGVRGRARGCPLPVCGGGARACMVVVVGFFRGGDEARGADCERCGARDDTTSRWLRGAAAADCERAPGRGSDEDSEEPRAD